MKFRIAPTFSHLHLYDIEVTEKTKDIGSNLTLDKRISDVFNYRIKWTRSDMPWLVTYSDFTTVILNSQEHLAIMAVQNGEGFSGFDCYISGKTIIDGVDKFCKKMNLELFVYGRQHNGKYTLGHRPFDNERFQRKYINMKLGDEKPYLTWTVFHEILGEDYSIFK